MKVVRLTVVFRRNMEYILGPVVAIAASFGWVKLSNKQLEAMVTNQNEKIAQLEKLVEDRDNEMAKKVMTTLMPVAKAVNRLNQTVGV